MLQRLVLIEDRPNFFDASDALAVALCHHYSNSSVINVQGKTIKGWKEFITQNPERMR